MRHAVELARRRLTSGDACLTLGIDTLRGARQEVGAGMRDDLGFGPALHA